MNNNNNQQQQGQKQESLEKLTFLRSAFERKASKFNDAKNKSLEKARQYIQDLRKLIDFIEDTILREIERKIGANKFEETLCNLDENLDVNEIDRLQELVDEIIPTFIGPSDEDYQRVREAIIRLNSWHNKSRFPPKHIKGMCMDASNVKLVWDKVEGAIEYHAEMRYPNESEFHCVYKGHEEKCDVGGLCLGTKVLFRLKSVFENDVVSEWSDCIEVSTAAPQYVYAEGRSESEIDVRWDRIEISGSDEVPVYRVEMKPKNDINAKFEKIYDGRENRCTVNRLKSEEEEEYLFCVRTFYKGICINQSYVVGKTKIPTPKEFKVETDNWNEISLSWNPVVSKTRTPVFYIVEMKKANENDPMFAKIYEGKKTKIKKTEFQQETEYSFRVRSKCGSELSEWSEIVKIKSKCTWKECPDYVDEKKKYLVDGNNPRIATKNNGYDNSTFIGNTPLPPNKVTSWNIKILKIHNNGYGIYIGVAPFDINQNENYNHEKCGWYFNCYFSTLYSGPPHNYKFLSKKYGPRGENGKYIHTGDSVGVVMDSLNGDLSFSLNGMNLGIAYEGIPLDKPLVPCVILFWLGDSIELDTSEVKETKVSSSIPIPSNITIKGITWDSIALTWDVVEGTSFHLVEVDGREIFNVFTSNLFTGRGFYPESEHRFRVRAVKGTVLSEWSDVVKESTIKAPEFSKCVWKEYPDYVDGKMKYSVDEKNLRIATKINEHDECIIIGNAPLPFNKVTSWSIKILNLKDNDGCIIHIGIAPSDINQNKAAIFFECGWYFFCNVSILCSGPPHNYICKDYGPRRELGNYIHTGDSVGVVMDTTKGELSFVLNGVNYGVAYEGIPLDKPLVPCAILGEKGYSVELDLSEVKETEVKSSILVPSNITTKSVTWDSITLTWNVVEGASFYQIKVDENKSWGATTTNAFTKTCLLPETVHSFRVRTVRGNKVSEWSGVVKGKTQEKMFETGGWKDSLDDVSWKHYSIDEKNPRIVTKATGDDFDCTILGNTLLPLNKDTSWSIKLLKSRNNDGDGIYIGVAPFDINQNGYNKCGWYYNCYESTLHSGPPHNYKGKEYGPRKTYCNYARTGNRIGVVINTLKGELSFIVGVVNYGIAYEGIPLDKPLVPCVHLWYEGDSVILIL